MAAHPLSRARILIVEDEPIIAFDLQTTLADAGAVIVGPAATLTTAEALARSNDLSAALLDVHVAGKPVFPVAQVLMARGVPFAFHTGYGDKFGLRQTWPTTQVLAKPARADMLVGALARLLGRKA